MGRGEKVKPRTTCTDPDQGQLLAAYDAGILEPEERAAFERHVSSCEACREELYELAPHVAQLHQHRDRAAAVLARHAECSGQPERVRRSAWWRSMLASLAVPAGSTWRWAALVPVVAAGIVIVLVIGRGRPGSPAGLAQLEPLPFTHVETRAGEDPALADFDAGMDLYLAGDYAGAADRLAATERRLDRRVTAPGPVAPARVRQRADQAALYAGVGFLMAGQRDSARVHLGRALESHMAMVNDHARWYLAQAALQEGDRARAVEQLRRLAGGSPAYGQRAAEQLRALGLATP